MTHKERLDILDRLKVLKARKQAAVTTLSSERAKGGDPTTLKQVAARLTLIESAVGLDPATLAGEGRK